MIYNTVKVNTGKIVYQKVETKSYKKSNESHKWKGGKPKCLDCSSLTTQYNTKRCRKCYLKTMKGETSPAWKGGVTSLRMRIMNTAHYKNWRLKVFIRDEYTCQNCFGWGGTLHADHIKPFSAIIKENHINSVEMALVCNELWNIDNGQTLCVECHKQTDTFLSGAFKYLK